jgi:hypothetical protein
MIGSEELTKRVTSPPLLLKKKVLGDIHFSFFSSQFLPGRSVIILLLSLVLWSGKVQCQLIKIKIQVKSNISIEQLRPLNFSSTLSSNTLKADSGKKILSAIKSDSSTQIFRFWGVYSLAASENILALVHLETSDILVDDQKNTIPFKITMTWQNDGSQNEITAKPAENNKCIFPLNNSGQLIEDMINAPSLLHAYIFLTGTAIVPNTSKATYVGQAYMIIEYE